MNAIDPRELSDKALLAYLLVGSLPRPGWPNRGRVIARRLLQLAAIAASVTLGLALVRLAVIVLWAASLPA